MFRGKNTRTPPHLFGSQPNSLDYARQIQTHVLTDRNLFLWRDWNLIYGNPVLARETFSWFPLHFLEDECNISGAEDPLFTTTTTPS